MRRIELGEPRGITHCCSRRRRRRRGRDERSDKDVQGAHDSSDSSLGKAVIEGKADLAKLDGAWIKVTMAKDQCSNKANGDLWIATSRLVAVRPQK